MVSTLTTSILAKASKALLARAAALVSLVGTGRIEVEEPSGRELREDLPENLRGSRVEGHAGGGFGEDHVGTGLPSGSLARALLGCSTMTRALRIRMTGNGSVTSAMTPSAFAAESDGAGTTPSTSGRQPAGRRDLERAGKQGLDPGQAPEAQRLPIGGGVAGAGDRA